MKTKKKNITWAILLFTIAMIAATVLVKDTIINLRLNGAHCYVKEYWGPAILSTIRAALREEIIWRLPYIISYSSIILLLKYLKAKKSFTIIVHLISCIAIFLVQLQFAYVLHKNPYTNVDDIDILLIHGSAGIFFCAAYIFPMILIMKAMIKKLGGITDIKKFFAVIFASNTVGLVCAMITHLISNVIIIFMHTYYPLQC